MSRQSLAIVSKESWTLSWVIQHPRWWYLFFARDHKTNDILTNRQHYQYLPETTIKNVLDLMGRSSSKKNLRCIFDFCKRVYVLGLSLNSPKKSSLKSALRTVLWTDKAAIQWRQLCMWLNRAESGGFCSWSNTTTPGLIFRTCCRGVHEWCYWNWHRAVGSTEVGIQGDDITFQCLPQMGPAQLFSGRPIDGVLYSGNNDVVADSFGEASWLVPKQRLMLK